MAFTDADIAQAHQAATHQGALPDDLYRLGLIYSTGQGGAVDLVEAHKWFNLAAVRGSEDAKLCRKDMAEQMSIHEIAAAQKAAREWLTRH